VGLNTKQSDSGLEFGLEINKWGQDTSRGHHLLGLLDQKK